MTTTAWRLPDAPLRASAVSTSLAGLFAVVSLAAAMRAGVPVSAFYAWKALAAFLALTLVSIGFLQEHHPFERFGPANQVTTVRAALVALIVALIGEPPSPILGAAAAGASVLVTVLDGVDGWLARRHHIASAFGARFDMEVDALLILALSMLAWQFEKAGAWVIASGAMRYAFVAAGAVWAWMKAPLPDSVRRKTVCVVQVVALTVAIVPSIPWPASAVLAAAALGALSCSFLVDTVWLWRHAA